MIWYELKNSILESILAKDVMTALFFPVMKFCSSRGVKLLIKFPILIYTWPITEVGHRTELQITQINTQNKNLNSNLYEDAQRPNKFKMMPFFLGILQRFLK